MTTSPNLSHLKNLLLFEGGDPPSYTNRIGRVDDVQGLKLDPVSHRVTANDVPLDMGPTEFKMLHFLWLTKSECTVASNYWITFGAPMYVEDRTVDVHIRRLRKALKMLGTISWFKRFVVLATASQRKRKELGL